MENGGDRGDGVKRFEQEKQRGVRKDPFCATVHFLNTFSPYFKPQLQIQLYLFKMVVQLID